MRLLKQSMYRLYDLSEKQNEDGCYELVPFSDDIAAYNQDIVADSIDETLTELADALYGQGSRWYEITDGDYTEDGKIDMEIDDDNRLEIRDITDTIDSDPERSQFFIVVDANRTDYQWVIATSQGAVYSG